MIPFRPFPAMNAAAVQFCRDVFERRAGGSQLADETEHLLLGRAGHKMHAIGTELETVGNAAHSLAAFLLGTESRFRASSNHKPLVFGKGIDDATHENIGRTVALGPFSA